MYLGVGVIKVTSQMTREKLDYFIDDAKKLTIWRKKICWKLTLHKKENSNCIKSLNITGKSNERNRRKIDVIQESIFMTLVGKGIF